MVMYYYLIELSNPKVKLRHYRNSRVAEYTVAQLNKRAGEEKYGYIQTDEAVNVDYVGENPVDAKVQFLKESNETD